MVDDSQAATSVAQNDGKEQAATTAPTAKPDTKQLTQAEIDAIVEDRLKRDRQTREEALAKDLGMSIKEAKAFLKAKKDAEEKEKSDLQKALEQLAEKEKAIKDRDLRDFKRSQVDSLIADKKIRLPDGVTISDVLDMVNGPDEDGIKASAEKLIKFFPFNASMGTGTNPANAGKKDPSIDEKIAEAEKAGNWGLATKLKLQKQREIFKS